jgi:hypothetical protein
MSAELLRRSETAKIILELSEVQAQAKRRLGSGSVSGKQTNLDLANGLRRFWLLYLVSMKSTASLETDPFEMAMSLPSGEKR